MKHDWQRTVKGVRCSRCGAPKGSRWVGKDCKPKER